MLCLPAAKKGQGNVVDRCSELSLFTGSFAATVAFYQHALQMQGSSVAVHGEVAYLMLIEAKCQPHRRL